MTKEAYICDYKVLIADTISDLEELVHDGIEYGWQPQGGMNPLRHGELRERFTQAVVRFCER